MNTVGEAIRTAAERLAATSDTPRLDAEVLMAHALGANRSELLLRRLCDPVPVGYDELIERRSSSEPVAYITGIQEFYGLDLVVTPDVLIPRADSESLIEAARDELALRPPRTIIDLGTGSGALLLAALTVWPQAEGRGLDRSIEALMIAIRNAQRHANTPVAVVGSGPATPPTEKPDRGFARFIQRDWTKRGWRADLGRFDLVLCNPPYVEDYAALAPDVREHEPHGALFAGVEGLEHYRLLMPQLPKLLEPGGIAVFEIGHTQAEAVTAIAAATGLSATLRRDLARRPRALILRSSCR